MTLDVKTATVKCIIFFFIGRREFVQRLKREAVLSVHDGCVSLSSLCFTCNEVSSCVWCSCPPAVFLCWLFFSLDKCACRRMCLSGLYCLRGINVLLFCVSVVCASLSTRLSVAPVLYLSVILNSKPDRRQAAIGDVLLSVLYCWDIRRSHALYFNCKPRK